MSLLPWIAQRGSSAASLARDAAAMRLASCSSGRSDIAAVPLWNCDSTPGAILQPQPPPGESAVKRGSGVFRPTTPGNRWNTCGPGAVDLSLRVQRDRTSSVRQGLV